MPKSKNLLLKFSAASAIAAIAYFSFSIVLHDSTSRLADQKHVSKLLALPELPESADANLNQLQLFMQSGWRRYISNDSLSKLNQKKQSLLRAKTAYPLKVALSSILSRPIRDDELDAADRQLINYRSDAAYRLIDSSTKESVDRLVNEVAIRRTSIARAREAEAERIREQQEQNNTGLEGNGGTSPSTQTGFILGPRGGCYYISQSGGKEYVDRSNCY